MKRHSFVILVCLSMVTVFIITTGFTGIETSVYLIGDKCNNSNNQLIVNGKEMLNDTSEKNLVVTRVFDAPVESVWKAWSEPEQVMKWWGPAGFTSPSCKMSFYEGGISLVCMRAPKEFGGQDLYNTWTYQKIEPMHRIEFILNFADKGGNKLDPARMGMPAGIPKDVPHIIIFKNLGDSKTELTVTEYGYTSDQAVNISKTGLEQCLDKMAVSFTRD